MFTSPIFFFLSLFIVLLLAPRIFRNPKWGVLLLIFLLPFERIPSWDIPWEWGITLRLSQVVALVLMAAFIFQIARGKIDKMKLKKYLNNPVVFSILAYLLVALLSVSWAIDREKALLVTGFTLFTALIGFLAYFWIDQKDLLPKIEKVLFYVILIVSIFGLYQFLADSFDLSIFWSGLKERYLKEVLGFPRIQSVALEPLFLVNFLLIPWALFSSLFLTNKTQLSQGKLILALILMTINIVLAVSRGGYIASIMAIVLIAVLLAKEYSWKQLFRYLGVLLIGLILAIGLVFLSSYISFGDRSGAKNLLSHSSRLTLDEGKELKSRQEVWSWAIKAFKENPIQGVGAGNFGAWMGQQGYPGRQRVVNNEPLEILAETGILGAIPILLMIFFVTAGFIRVRRRTEADPYLQIWLVSLLVAFWASWVQYLTFSTLYISHFWLLIGLLMAVQRLAYNYDHR